MASKTITRKISIFINGKEVENNLNSVGKEVGKLKGQLRSLVPGTQEFIDKSKELKKAQGAYADINNEIRGTNGLLDKMKAKLGPVASGFLEAFSIAAVVAGAVSALRGASKTINEFEQAVADLKAITGATGDDLEYLKKQAIDLGAQTKGGAVAVVEAYKLIASAKPELLENVEALNQVTKATLLLAKASGMEMPAAATALTDAMNQYGADASKAIVFVDALANGAKYGAAEIDNETEALLKFGAVARTSNVSIEESVGLIQLMAENGDKGAEAGTKLRNVLLKISAPDALPKEAQAIFQELGISMEFLKDKTIPIQQKLEALKPLLQDNANIVKVFGLENSVAALNVLGHTDRLAELTSKMGEVGTAQEQAAIKMDTVGNKTELLKSKYDSLILSVSNGGGAVSGFFKFWIDGASAAIDDLFRLNSTWDELYEKAKGDGTAKGVKSFAERFNNLKGTGNDAEISKSIKESARNTLYTLNQSYDEIQSKIDNYNPWAHFDGAAEDELKVKKEALTKEIAAYNSVINEANNKINAFENPYLGNTPTTTGTPTGTPTTPTGTDPAETAAKAKEAKLVQLEEKFKADRLKRLAVTNEEKAQLASDEALQEATALGAKQELLDSIEAEHKIKIDAAKVADDELEKQKIRDFDAAKKSIQDEIDLQKATTEEEASAIKLTQDLEKQLSELATLEFNETQKGELKKKIIEKYNNDIDKLTEAAAVKRAKAQAEFNITEINFEKQKNEIKIGLAQQLGNTLLSVLGDSLGGQLAAIAFNAIIEIVKLKIATSAAQQINMANAVALSLPTAGASVVAATALNLALGASSKLQQASIISAAAISGLGATLSKSKKKGFKTGGYTGFGDDNDVAGVQHKDEYVIPKFILQDPTYSPIINQLEAKRTETLGVQNSLPGNISSASNQQNEMLSIIFTRLMAKLDEPIIAAALIGDNQINDFGKRSDKLKQVRNNAKIQ